MSAGAHAGGWSSAYRIAGKLVALARQYETAAAAAAASGAGAEVDDVADSQGGKSAHVDSEAAAAAPFRHHLRQLWDEARQQLGPTLLAELMGELTAAS